MSRRIPRLLCALIVIAAIASASVFALADSVEVKLNASVKVYQSASSSAKSVKVPKGLRVELKACAKGWGQITYKGRTAYVKLKYLDRVDPLKAYVTENATVYKDAAGSKRLATASQGAVVYVIGVDGSYVRIQNKSGSKKGYIKSGVLSSGKVSAPAQTSSAQSGAQSVPESLRATEDGAKSSRIEKVIYAAQSLIGTPYAAKADPPKTFDCATYAYYCFAKAGVKLSSSSKSQGYDDTYDKIDYDHLKRGDLVCFDTVSDKDASDHVGIYLGSGYFLHGSSSAKKVILSSLSSGYYKRTFSWGRRILSD